MSVKIRLRRVGTKNCPSFRFVVTEKSRARDGKAIEIVGHYDPLTEPATVVIEKDKIIQWVKQGAQLSLAVRNLLKKKGVLKELAR